MKEEKVKFETAKLAKEKGFDIKCKNPVNQNGVKLGGISGGGGNIMDERIQIPTQSLLQKWLREIHGLVIDIDYDGSEKWFYTISKYPSTDFLLSEGGYEKYEEALEYSLQESLKLI